MQKKFSFLWAFTLFLWGCTSKNAESDTVNTKDLFATFLFTADDGAETVNCLVQFSRRKNGKGLYLPQQTALYIDGQLLTGDSISIGEVYYETQLPLSQFGGDHEIVLKDADGIVFKQELNLKPVVLASRIPEKLKRADLVFILKGVEAGEKIQLAMVDTAFSTNDFHLDTTLQGNRLPVAKSQLAAVKSGPLTVYLMVEKQLLVNSDLRGQIIIRYIFRRETELVD